MKAGKSDDLLRAAEGYEIQNLPVLFAKPGDDTRGGNMIISRRPPVRKREVDILIAPDADIVEIFEPVLAAQATVKAVECIMIDEAQFLSPEQIHSLYWDITQDRDTSIIAYGLRADAFCNPFPGSAKIMALADDIREVISVCKCGTQAKMNTRMVDGKFVFEGDQFALDEEGQGVTTYDALCKDCYRREYLTYFAAKGAVGQNVTSPI